MIDKKAQRQKYKYIRSSISAEEKSSADKRIFESFINSRYFNDFSTFLIYVSFGSEVDTRVIINFALKNHKRIAVPHCDGGVMTFYEIKSLDDLVIGAYGIPTVDILKSTQITDFSNSLCIVPALAFDRSGNRLGYGGGYYDRFLAENKLPALGLCFDRCIADELPAETFDMKINRILTENNLETLNKEASTYE